MPWSPALIRAKCLRIRLVNGRFSATQACGCIGQFASGIAGTGNYVHGVFRGRTGIAINRIQASGLKSMSAQRMTLEPRNPQAGVGRRLRLAVGLIALALPLSGCGTGSLWDKFLAKDDTFVEEPADKLYNEGLYLMNQRKDPKAASKKFEEVDRQHPYSDWARKSLLMSAYSFYQAGDYDNCIGAATRYVTLHPGSPDAAYAQYLIAASHYDQIPDITRDQTRTEKAIAALEEVVRKYPTSEYATSAKAKLEGARDQLAGKRDECRPLLHGQARLHRRHQPLQDRGDAIPDHAACGGSAGPADRSLYGDRHHRRGADRSRGAWPQFS